MSECEHQQAASGHRFKVYSVAGDDMCAACNAASGHMLCITTLPDPHKVCTNA